jgi:putative chitobiose transport system permease protein
MTVNSGVRGSYLTAATKRHIGRATRYLILIIVALFCLIPIYWIIASSLKTQGTIERYPPQIIPNPLSGSNYVTAEQTVPVLRWVANSAIIAVIEIIFNVAFCSMAGYTLARKNFRFRGVIFGLVVASMMVPVYVRLIPNYELTLHLHMLNTYQGIVLPSLVTGFGIFLMRQYFSAMPTEVEDSARMDGCGDWGVLFRVLVPMARPAVASLAIFTLVFSLDDFLWPLIVTSQNNMRPLPVGITLFISTTINWGPLTAVTVLTILPTIILYSIFNRHFVNALTAGAVKG